MDVSVIICTRNRGHALQPCLDSVKTAIEKVPEAAIELIVVDNGSSDDTKKILEGWGSVSNLNIQLPYEPRRGLSAARNCGIAAATGNWILFTDDDCRLDPNYLERLIAYAKSDIQPVIRGGYIALGDPSDIEMTIKTDPNRQIWQLKNPADIFDVVSGKSLNGCNMAMSRSVIEAVGLFDERLGAGSPIPGGEDTDYYIRAFFKDIPIEYLPDLVVHHFHGRKTVAEGKSLMGNYMIATGALYAKYFSVRPIIYKELIWDIRKMVQEFFKGRSLYWPEIGFSYAKRVRFSLEGFRRFLMASNIQAPQKGE